MSWFSSPSPSGSKLVTDGGEVQTTHGRRPESAPAPAAAPPTPTPTPRQWFDGMAALATKHGVPVPVVPDRADDAWFIEQGKRLQAETKDVLAGGAR